MKGSYIFTVLVASVLLLNLQACGGKEKPAANGGAANTSGTNGGNAAGGNDAGGSNAGGGITLEPGQNTPIQFSHLVMQFGPVTSGDTVKADYPFKNVTNTPVKITQAVTSCPCMMTEFPTHQIQPKEEGVVKVRFATAGQFGRHEKIISVVLEGSNMPITLRLNGQINQK